jgi:hypothetical protein
MFARIEAVCANAVERAFALAFPSALEPVHVARKLVAAFESGTGSRGGRRFVVHIGPADFAKLSDELPYLERQWTTMLVRLVERTGRPERPPLVAIVRDERVASGTVNIAVDERPQPARLALRVRKGMPAGARASLDHRITIGRDPACDLVLLDSRVSRRHLEIVPDGAVLRLRDTGSSNGTTLNGNAVTVADLGLGDVLRIGDSELVVEPEG